MRRRGRSQVRCADHALACCRERLNPGGSLIINIPSSEGFFYRMAALIDWFGGPLDRMWQKNVSSPHVSYFRPEHLKILAQRNGLREAYHSSLPSIQCARSLGAVALRSLYRLWTSALVFAGVAGPSPFFRPLLADIDLQIFSRPEQTGYDF
jgi:hypothetical protein